VANAGGDRHDFGANRRDEHPQSAMEWLRRHVRVDRRKANVSKRERNHIIGRSSRGRQAVRLRVLLQGIHTATYGRAGNTRGEAHADDAGLCAGAFQRGC